MSAAASLRASAGVAFGGMAGRVERSLPRFVLVSVLVHSAPLLTLLSFALAPKPISRSLASPASEVAVDLFARSDDATSAAASKESADPLDPLDPPESAPAEPELAPSLALEPAPVPRARTKKQKPNAADDAPQAQAAPSAQPELVDGGANVAAGGPAVASEDTGGSSIELVIHADRLREHPIGARLLPLVASVAGWRELFRAAGLDPRTGIDRIMVHGTDLRDSRTFASAFNLSSRGESSAHDALEKLVGEDSEHGHSLDAGVPMAASGSGDAARIYALPAPGVVIVAPSELLARALRLGQTASQASAPPDELAALYVQSPWRFGQGLGLELPRAITWLRVNVTSDSDGLVGIDVRAGTESAELARALAGDLERIVSTLGERASSAIDSSRTPKHKKAKNLVERSELAPHGTRIVGRVVLRPAALEALAEIAEAARER